MGLDTLTTPIIRDPLRIGAATYMAFASSGSVREVSIKLVRAPYWPSRVKRTSRHCEKSKPVSVPLES